MAVEYTLSLPEPHTHLYGVEVRLPSASGAVELVMPSWTPGSYLIREFPRNVQDFEAHDASGLRLPWRKTDKNTWRIDADPVGPLTVRYRVYANELSVRTSHLDASHGAVNGASLFMYVRGAEREEARLRVEAPPEWRVATSLKEGEDGTFAAADYDELVDSPLEIGTHSTLVWEQLGRPHRYAIWGRGTVDEARLMADTGRIVEVGAEMFGGLPYDDFLFIVHVVPEGRGGLEHASSTVLQVPPSWLSGADYENLLALVAHEFFHVWLGKRIRPAALGPFDYTRENYTRSLWVVEGWTSYYTDRMLLRAGLMTPERYLDRLGDLIARHEALPGRHHQSLEESSFDAWIKFYRPDAHTPNSQVSYYQKGALAALALDLEIRRASGGQRSLDDVVRMLWARYRETGAGFAEEGTGGVEEAVREMGGAEVVELLEKYVRGKAEIDFDAHLEVVGLQLTEGKEESGSGTGAVATPPRLASPGVEESRLGLRLREEGGRLRVTHALEDTPARAAGFNAGEEIVAVDDMRATLATVRARLQAGSVGDRVRFAVLRRDELMTLEARLGEQTVRRSRIVPQPDADEGAERVRREWLGRGGDAVMGAVGDRS